MRKFLSKMFRFSNNSMPDKNRSTGIVKALVEENESLKEKLNFYVDSYLRNKEKMEYVSFMLASHEYNQNFDDYLLKIKEYNSKRVNHEEIHLIIYCKDGKNKIHTLETGGDFVARNKKYLEETSYEQIVKSNFQDFCRHFNFYKLQEQHKEYGYIILGNNDKTILEEVNDLTAINAQIISKALAHCEHNRDFENDKQDKIEFLVNFSHEIRTPLNGIIIYSELLKNEEENSSEKVKKYIKNIGISARQLAYLMTYITESAKTKYSQLKINKEKFSTSTEILNILSVFHSKILEKNLKVEKILTDVKLNSDIAKFNQILYNLVSNAIKYSPNNSKITLSSWFENGEFNFEIKDEGCGINEKESDKIFKFLSRGSSKEHKEGSGIGLALTKKIIEIQGGKIGYASKPDKGTTFWFHLPLDGGL